MSELPYDQRDRNLAVLLHLSSFAGIIIPYAGFVAPIVIWLVYKESDFVNRQGFIFFTGLISYTIFVIGSRGQKTTGNGSPPARNGRLPGSTNFSESLLFDRPSELIVRLAK